MDDLIEYQMVVLPNGDGIDPEMVNYISLTGNTWVGVRPNVRIKTKNNKSIVIRFDSIENAEAWACDFSKTYKIRLYGIDA